MVNEWERDRDDDQDDDQDDDHSESRLSEVSSSLSKITDKFNSLQPEKRKKAIFIAGGSVLLLLVYIIFSGGDDKTSKKEIVNNQQSSISNEKNNVSSVKEEKVDNNDYFAEDFIDDFDVSPVIPDTPKEPPPLVVPTESPAAPDFPPPIFEVPVVDAPPINNLRAPIIAPPLLSKIDNNSSDLNKDLPLMLPNKDGDLVKSFAAKSIDTSSIVALGGGSGGAGGGQGSSDGQGGVYGINPNDPLGSAQNILGRMGNQNQSFASDAAPPAHTSAAQSMATSYGNRETMIAQGKLVQAVLETAINSSMPGYVRAMVSRDVYSEGGHNVLIPKGSRLVGTYNVGGTFGRVDITWHRIMRSDGVDIVVDTSAIDKLGRGGMEGEADFKIMESLRNALLISSISVGSAALAFKIIGGGDVTTTTSKDGNTTVTSSPVDRAIEDATSSLRESMSSAVSKALPTQTIVKINQGTQIQVFVNQDIVFSRSVANLGKIR